MRYKKNDPVNKILVEVTVQEKRPPPQKAVKLTKELWNYLNQHCNTRCDNCGQVCEIFDGNAYSVFWRLEDNFKYFEVEAYLVSKDVPLNSYVVVENHELITYTEEDFLSKYEIVDLVRK